MGELGRGEKIIKEIQEVEILYSLLAMRMSLQTMYHIEG